MPRHKVYTSLYQLPPKEEWSTAHVTFSQDNFTKTYSLASRTYQISSRAKFFDSEMIGKSLFGSALDGSDPCVRLDHYNWKIEKIVIVK